jgi:methyl-accepting chemotaxis protein
MKLPFLKSLLPSSQVDSKYKKKFEAINRSQAVIEFDLNGNIVDANDNFLQAMGYTLDDIKGQHHGIFVDPVYRDSQEYADFWHRLGQGKYDAKEYKRFGKDGQEVWIQASYNPLFDDAGKPCGVIKFATEVTAQKLRNADYEGQIAAIGKSQAVIEFNLDGTVMTANQNFLDTVEYSLSDILGQHHRLFVDKAYGESDEYQQFWANLRNGQYEAGVYKRFGRDGKEVWIRASYNPIFDVEGRPFKVVKYATDITAQKREDANYMGQVNAISKAQAVIEFDLEGTILNANQNFLKTMGYSLDEIQGQKHKMFVDKVEGQSQDYKNFWEKLRSGQHEARVYRRLGKGGKEVWIDATYNPILDMDGRPFKVVKFANDVSPLMETVGLSDRTSNKMQDISSSIAEMASAIDEISKNMASSRDAASDISKKIQSTSEASSRLTSTMDTMESVVQLIRDIAEQVNLLALNATIEAARAGEAGKGFAVVASEVKNLANQTSQATDDIASQITLVQSVAQDVSASIGNIVQQASSVDEYIRNSAQSVSKQDETTRAISQNAQEVSDAVKDISQRIRALSQAA